MPELPEVETVRRQLEVNILNKNINQIEVLHPKTTRFNEDFDGVLKEAMFTKISRRGKLLIFSTNDPQKFMTCHLKMTGILIYRDVENEMIGGGHSFTETDKVLPGKHTRAVFRFEDGSSMYFNDMRLFGYLRVIDAETLANTLAQYGIEPMTADYTWEAFQSIFKNRKTSLKALLLNQKVISGLGNIYVDEACFRSKIHPGRSASSLNKKEMKALFKNAEAVMQESVDMGGTTFYSFMDSRGRKGNFSDFLEVFAREGELCINCDTEIEKIRLAGRGTHFCPKCQSL